MLSVYREKSLMWMFLFCLLWVLTTPTWAQPPAAAGRNLLTLEEAVLDAGIIRLRPVMITVGATIFGLIPLAWHGGPLWEPLCYAQIGGLLVATLIILLLVPVFYSIFVMDLKIVRWETYAKLEVEGKVGESQT
jgi:Cu/Ag efflux pump CusA